MNGKNQLGSTSGIGYHKMPPFSPMKISPLSRQSAATWTLCLVVLAAGALSLDAAPRKKQAPATPPPPPVEVEPVSKRSFLNRLKAPFSKKDAPSEVTPPPPASRADAKKAAPGTKRGKGADRPPAAVAPAVPQKSLSDAKTRKPASLPPVAAPEEPKKPGFFSRLKNRITGGESRDTDGDQHARTSGNPASELTVNGQGGPPSHENDAKSAPGKPERPADWKERWIISEDEVKFFAFGPSQASGPDMRLGKGDVVKVVQTEKSWTRVELDGGRTGYIGTDQLRQAAESDFASPRSAPATQLAASSNPQYWAPAAPMPDLPDLPMAPGTENALFLLPPLAGQSIYNPTTDGPPVLNEPPDLEQKTLKPGDSVDTAQPQIPEDGSGTPAPATENDLPAAPAPEAPVPPETPPVPPAPPKEAPPANPDSTEKPAPPSPALEPAPMPVPPPETEPSPAPTVPNNP